MVAFVVLYNGIDSKEEDSSGTVKQRLAGWCERSKRQTPTLPTTTTIAKRCQRRRACAGQRQTQRQGGAILCGWLGCASRPLEEGWQHGCDEGGGGPVEAIHGKALWLVLGRDIGVCVLREHVLKRLACGGGGRRLHGRVVWQVLLRNLHKCRKRAGLVDGKLAQHFAVQRNVCLSGGRGVKVRSS